MTRGRATVLHVSDADAWTGGCGQMMALARGLKARDWNIWIACRSSSSLAAAAARDGVSVFPVALRQDYDLVSAWRLASFIRREKVDLVHSHHSRSHGVCLLAKLLLCLRGGPRPVLVVSRRVSFKIARNPFSLFKYRSALIDAYAAVAEAVREVLRKSGVDPARVAVVHSGVDTERFAPRPPSPEVRRSLGLPDGVPVVCKVANAASWKGQGCFLEAASILIREGRSLHFVLVGRDTDGAAMKRKVSDLGLAEHVTLAGFREDVPDVLACMSLSVNAAVGGEGLSGAVRESLVSGIPAIASDVAGNRELFGEEHSGLLFPPGDAHALAGLIKSLLDKPEEARRAVESLRERVRREFSVEAMIGKSEDLYQTLLSSRLRVDAGPRHGWLLWAVKTSALAAAHPFAWLLLTAAALAGLPGLPDGQAFMAAGSLAVYGIPLVLGLCASRWLRLGLSATVGALLLVPLCVAVFSGAVEPEPFMHALGLDGSIQTILIPDPRWERAALLWSVATLVSGSAGWLLGRLWLDWPGRPGTRPPNP